MTPFEKATLKRPDFSKLHLFGAKCYYFNDMYKHKFDPRSIPAVFIGYENDSPSLIVYVPSDSKIKKM